MDLDGFFGLHPSLAPLGPLFHNGQLAIVHAAGSPDTTRSHFDAQDFMESGTPGVKSTDDGWLNRTVNGMSEQDASPFRAVAMGPNLPLTLRGAAPAIALADVKQFRVMSAVHRRCRRGGFEALYAQTVDKVLRGTGTETFEAIDMLRKAEPRASSRRMAPIIRRAASARRCNKSRSFSRRTSAWKSASSIPGAGTTT